jgi:hypothetical protein
MLADVHDRLHHQFQAAFSFEHLDVLPNLGRQNLQNKIN